MRKGAGHAAHHDMGGGGPVPQLMPAQVTRHGVTSSVRNTPGRSRSTGATTGMRRITYSGVSSGTTPASTTPSMAAFRVSA